MTPTYILKIRDLRLQLEHVSADTICVSQPGLGLTVYGNSPKDALEKMENAIRFVFEILITRGGTASVEKRFAKAGGVDYTLVEVEESPEPTVVSLAAAFVSQSPALV